jgi:hypothetical protein
LRNAAIQTLVIPLNSEEGNGYERDESLKRLENINPDRLLTEAGFNVVTF